MQVAARREQAIYSKHTCSVCGARLLFNHDESGEIVGYYHRCENIAGHPFLSVDLQLEPLDARKKAILSVWGEFIAVVRNLQRLGVSGKDILARARQLTK